MTTNDEWAICDGPCGRIVRAETLASCEQGGGTSERDAIALCTTCANDPSARVETTPTEDDR